VFVQHPSDKVTPTKHRYAWKTLHPRSHTNTGC